MAKQRGGDNTEVTVPQSAQEAFAAILEAEEQPPVKDSPQNQEAEEDEEEVVEETSEESDEEENPEESEEEEDEEGEEEEEGSASDKFDIENLDLDEEIVYKERELTLREALDDGLRQSDYSRKTADLAEQRKAFTDEQQAVAQERAEYVERLEQLKTVIEAQSPAELTQAEWDKLRRENPTEYAARKADAADAKERIEKINAEQQRTAEKDQKDAASQYQEYLKTQRTELLKRLPEWADEKVMTKEQEEMVVEAKSRGFTDDELALVDNHRIILLLRDATKYQQLQGKKPLVRKKAKRARVAAPGGAKRPKRKSKTPSARAALKETGRIQDAAGVFLAGLEEEDAALKKR